MIMTCCYEEGIFKTFTFLFLSVFYVSNGKCRELTLLWSKLQRRVDPSLESFLERCLQFGAIAKTAYHLLVLIQVIQTEVCFKDPLFFDKLKCFDYYKSL